MHAPPVFSITTPFIPLSLSSSDHLTAVAASSNHLWLATQTGRLARYHLSSHHCDELRGRLGSGRVDNAAAAIFPHPHPSAPVALIVLKNADAYFVRARDELRPRWLARMRGLRCVSATWLVVGGNSVLVFGTALGKLFALTIDDKYEKDDQLLNLWLAPGNARIHGVRIEQVTGYFIATIATASALYLFSPAETLPELFQPDNVTVINTTRPATEQTQLKSDLVLPSDLHFITGSSGFSSRRFVCASKQGVTHAQLQVRRRRTSLQPADASPTSSSVFIASVVDRETIPWELLKQTSGSAVPLAVNLSAFHVLVLYPATIYAFNHISGQLTQRLTLWSPPDPTRLRQHQPLVASSEPNLFNSPVVGFARDVQTDALWLYTADGQIAKFVASPQEHTEAWKAAKAMGRFDLAMALAPLVSGDASEQTVYQTREAVLEAQADHAAAAGDWDIAAQLYAKTNRPVEQVIVDIIDASNAKANQEADNMLNSSEMTQRLKGTQHVITYLVRKLDRIEASRPMQRTIIATLLVQLYASKLSYERSSVRSETQKDFQHFLADRHTDLDTPAALSMLIRNGCHDEAWKLAVLSGDLLTATNMSARRGLVDQALSLLRGNTVANDRDLLSRVIVTMCNTLLPQAPGKVAGAIFRVLRRGSLHPDHVVVVEGLARVAREVSNEELANQAYQSAVVHLFDVLLEHKSLMTAVRDIESGGFGHGTGTGTGTGTRPTDTASQWLHLITFLIHLHAEFGTESEAQRSYDHLVAPLVKTELRSKPAVQKAIGNMLVSVQNAGFRRLCVSLYQALGLHETAIEEAVKIDTGLAEETISQMTDIPKKLQRELWCMVAARSVDSVGVVERSRGMLHIEDVLTHMAPFESASERIKSAVADSLEEHKRLANVAKNNATTALSVTASLAMDVEKAKLAYEQRMKDSRHGYRTLSCGHKVKVDKKECKYCGKDAIEMMNEAFDSGFTLNGGSAEV